MRKSNKKTCKKCHNQGYIVEVKGQYAYAKICECILNCDVCEGQGHTIEINDNGYSYMKPCPKCESIRVRVKKYNRAEIPAKYYNKLQADSLKPINESVGMALTYAKDLFVDKYPYNRGFILMGPSGVGKTHLAIGTIAELTLKKAVNCLFKDFYYLLSDLKTAYSGGIAENEILEPLINTDVLVIDELGKGKSNEWELNILDQLISKRYNSSKKTLITTNYIARDIIPKNLKTTEILEDRVGERIASRLYEMCEPYLIKGNDFRKNTST
ncbi:MAG: ATP-binding protein [Candidatus Dadabacteria bacterium]|nr:ATP-binding protein [Candidatus Dadabacteria bacterium]NIQ14328.1 ATP-binding protein [Candidatus Dadabacteria bacterium]